MPILTRVRIGCVCLVQVSRARFEAIHISRFFYVKSLLTIYRWTSDIRLQQLVILCEKKSRYFKKIRHVQAEEFILINSQFIEQQMF